MRASVLALISSGTLIVACRVDRPSETLTCGTTADCAELAGDRVCMEGYCIVQNCPDDCSECNETARTCTVDCNAPDDCDTQITCPSGWTCTINCNGDGNCNDIMCTDNSRCTIHCNGTNACDDIDCDNACLCDLTCAAGACDTVSCPTRGNGANQVLCTVDGTTATPCDSSRAASCASC
jgi:hypothetical protein